MDREEKQTINHPRTDPGEPDPATVERLLDGTHHNPHSVLGAHPHPDGTVVRVLRPHADEVRVVREGGQSGEGQPLTRVHDAGRGSSTSPICH